MIEVLDLSLRVGSFSLERISFTIPTGKYAVLMGKTGSGKTTVLEAVCGLKPVRSGAIRLHGRDVTRLKPADRGIGYVPQDLALFQSMTVREQLAFAQVIRGRDKRAIAKDVAEFAELLGIERLLDRHPRGLSGGESQRVALGRALSFHPSLLALDEPFSALDDQTREEMYALVRLVQQRVGVTALHVTHNFSEAQRLADVVLVLKDGAVCETPLSASSDLPSPIRNPQSAI